MQKTMSENTVTFFIDWITLVCFLQVKQTYMFNILFVFLKAFEMKC